MKIIGICGTNASGKGTVPVILQKDIPCTHLSAREMIISAAKKEGIDITNRDDLRNYNEKRNREGKTLVSDLIEEFDIRENQDKLFIIESIRRVGEVKELRNHFQENFILVSVDAPSEIRYERIHKRGSITDSVSYERFIEQERLESINEDENQMNIPKCMGMADVKLVNEGDIEKFEEEIKSKLLSML